jgi:neutral ceramidase
MRKPDPCGRAFALATVVLTLAACGVSTPPDADVAARAASPRLDAGGASCVLNSPYLQVGSEIDAPGQRLEVDGPAAGRPGGACGANTQFRFGSGLHDITGPVANTSGMGWEYPLQVFSGLHTRLFARAFAIAAPCNGKRVAFVSADIGLIWPALRSGVLRQIAADPVLAAHYGGDNVMISATHTHQGPAGYSHDDGGNLFHLGYDDLNYRIIVDGIVAAIRLAHANLEAHAQSAPIRLAVGELLNANINRSPPAFALNSEAERREFVDSRGEEVDTDKRFVQLSLVRNGGSAVGVINWFGVHPTILGPNLPLVGSDHKGYASLGFERLMGTRYDKAPGSDTFVAAFAQTNEGDASPNLYIMERPFPDPTRGGGRDEYETNAIIGTKQLAKALELFERGQPLSGPVDYRLVHVPITDIEVTDPAVLAGLRHPPELDAAIKRTCDGTLGVSFGAGAEDGPGPGHEGVSCSDSPDAVALAAADLAAALNNDHVPATAWDMDIPSHLFAAAVLCQRDTIDPTGRDYTCQAEKPPFFPAGPAVLPLQIFRIGNLAIAALPWEVTTMAGRRIRKDLLQVLAPAGIDTVVIAGLANDFVNYLTTREEYSSQQYEGASTLYGPWTLAAVQQELRKLAATLRDGTPAPEGPAAPADTSPGLMRTPYVPSDVPGAAGFGALLTDVPAAATPGDTVRAEFQAAHPRNDLKLQSSYVYAERQNAGGGWDVVATDKSPELLYIWKPTAPSLVPLDPAFVGTSTAEAVWTIPRNMPAGIYRLRHEGVAQTHSGAPLEPYAGTSSPFTLGAPISECP